MRPLLHLKIQTEQGSLLNSDISNIKCGYFNQLNENHPLKYNLHCAIPVFSESKINDLLTT